MRSHCWVVVVVLALSTSCSRDETSSSGEKTQEDVAAEAIDATESEDTLEAPTDDGPNSEDALPGPTDTGPPPPDTGGDDLDAPSPDTASPVDIASKPLGQACDEAPECESGFCVDGVCCAEACAATCMTCGTGSCANVPEGEDPSEECDGIAACDGTGSCFDRPIGTVCSAAYQCATGHCADGRCCKSACGGVCQTCDGQSPGTCTGVLAEVDEDTCGPGAGGGPCTAPPCACDPGGLCKPAGPVECSAATDCASGSCVGEICCLATCEDACHSCNSAHTAAADGDCAPAFEGTDPGGDCSSAAGCDGAGGCYETKPNGAACSASIECESTHCVEDVCCDKLCDGSCESCLAAFTEADDGVCAPIENLLDPYLECTGQTCCNGSGGCYFPVGGAGCKEGFVP